MSAVGEKNEKDIMHFRHCAFAASPRDCSLTSKSRGRPLSLVDNHATLAQPISIVLSDMLQQMGVATDVKDSIVFFGRYYYVVVVGIQKKKGVVSKIYGLLAHHSMPDSVSIRAIFSSPRSLFHQKKESSIY